MCGIAAALLADEGAAHRAVEAMCAQMVARGPDDEGIEVTRNGLALALGSRRLAIIDPSPAGHQPMADPERGLSIVFNGMIYNFRELRARLEAEGERFGSGADTEVILRAYGRYGADCVRHLHGMFAFAIWDAHRGELFLARDRLGIKPLYYRQEGDTLLVASQVKALLATGLVEPRLEPEAIGSYLAFGSVSDPLTAIAGVRSLPAAHTATLRAGALELRRYWEPPQPEARAPDRGGAARELRELLAGVVEHHLIADAPLGVFLSGGIDSSALAALAARRTPHVRTLAVVFDEERFSEQDASDLVAAHIGSEHVRVRLRSSDLLGSLPAAFAAMDQPSMDGLQTYAVSRAAHESGLKVALSGLGGDELFDGYGYVRRVRTLERARRLPAPLRAVAAHAAGRALGAGAGEKAASWLRGAPEPGSSYELLRRVFLPGELRALAPAASDGAVLPRLRGRADLYSELSALDLSHYTRNTLLRDTDAMSMAVSLEVRVPYLDDALVEWALRTPAATKGERKALLVEAARDLLPPEIFTRPKRGFVLPLEDWMRGPLRDEVTAVVADPPAPVAELLDTAAARRVLQEYGQGRGRWARPWALYSLCRWATTLDAHPAAVAA